MEYSSAIKEWPLLFPETRKTAILICEGKTEVEIIELSKSINIYQLTKEIRRIKLPQKILVRLRSLTEEHKHLLAYGIETTSKLVCFLGVMKTDILLLEFMQEIYAEKVSLRQEEIIDSDFAVFFDRKANESQKVAEWTSNNLKQIRNAYKRMLVDAGLAKKRSSDLIITIPICDENELKIIRRGNEIYADLMGVKQ